MTELLSLQPATVGGAYISVPTAPLRTFIADAGAIHHPTSQELFDKMYRSQVDSERHMSSALMYVGSLGLVAKLQAMARADEARLHEAVERGEKPEDATANDSTSSSSSPSSSTTAAARIPTSTVPIQQHHFNHITLLEENLLASRCALAQLLDSTGEHRTPMVTNTVLIKKMGERLQEARRIAMARGLVRRMNDNVDVKGNTQVVGEVNKVDVGRIEREREEILKLMDDVKARHEAFLNS